MYYNRFRYYSPEEGMYVTAQDPIRISSGASLYTYVSDSNKYLDIYGLMELFHGTTLENANKIRQNGVDLSKNRYNLDSNTQNSGAFYTSNSLKDTQKYNNRFTEATDIVKFDIPDEELVDLKIKTFEGPTEEWADFVTKARKGELVHDFDIVIGPKLANPEDVLTGGTPKAIKKQVQFAITSEKGASLLSKRIKCD